jgi:hypothetical protein
LLGRLASLGFGPDKVVPIAFHVDYFNEPWKDRFSDPKYSGREGTYNQVMDRKDLYFTPMMMVDGRYPMLGSDQPKAQAALRKVLSEKPPASLSLSLSPTTAGALKKTLKVTASPIGPLLDGQEVLVGVAICEDPVTTKVLSGENGGKTLVEHHAVRRFEAEPMTFDGPGPKTASFALELGKDWVAKNCAVAVFLQSEKTGRIYQAESIPWSGQAPRK